MVTTDPIADMLTRIRNANDAYHEKVDMPASKIKAAVLEILKNEGFIKNVEQIEVEGHQVLRVVLKYGANREKVIKGLKRISKPGLRVYAGHEELPKVLGGLGIAIISTSKGIKTDKAARPCICLVIRWRYNMSRIGKKPIAVPAGVEVKIDGHTVTVKGPKGTLSRKLNPAIDVKVEDGQVNVIRPNDEKESRSLHGLCRTLVNNMVVGVTQGFEKKLEIQGVGYNAQMQGRNLKLSLGFSHPVIITPPEGITLSTPSSVIIVVSGADKEMVGQVASEIRNWRRPEPYKGKGIRYSGEHVRRKAGKTGATK